MSHTAKDWWKAERQCIKSWLTFKTALLNAFLAKDHAIEAVRRIREHTQRPGESICDFTYQYRALCMRWKPQMEEREIVQGALHNCNPHTAYVLRNTVTSNSEFVRLGTLVERDFNAAKEFRRKPNPTKEI